MEPLVLYSHWLFIRPHKVGDEEALNKAVLASFAQLSIWMDWAIKPPDIAETRAYIDFSIKCWQEGKPSELPFLLFDTSGEYLIGATSFRAINWQIPAFEIGYWVNNEYSGKGYITEAVNIMIYHAFSRWNAKRIEIRCDSENSKSAAIPQRLGFLLEGHFKNHRIQSLSQKLSGTFVYARYDSLDLSSISHSMV